MDTDVTDEIGAKGNEALLDQRRFVLRLEKDIRHWMEEKVRRENKRETKYMFSTRINVNALRLADHEKNEIIESSRRNEERESLNVSKIKENWEK